MATKRPVIGVTCDYVDGKEKYLVNFAYTRQIDAAGGIPLMLPFESSDDAIPQLVDLLDGICFTGGDDLDPAAWGESRHPRAVAVNPARERYERLLMAEVERRRMPALGVCMGSQLMNVVRGGSMHQYLPEVERGGAALEHRKLNDRDARHTVFVEPDSVLAKALGGVEVTANSAHKQSVARLGRGLRVLATAPDGVIEAFEDPSLPLWLGVQWHPERVDDVPAHAGLFRLLVDKARG